MSIKPSRFAPAKIGDENHLVKRYNNVAFQLDDAATACRCEAAGDDVVIACGTNPAAGPRGDVARRGRT